ncbi:MAG: hypothetical protein RMK52_04600 [Chitinophagales bacterium]|nr:hypothetical protein [Chitinophagales bacterium]MDW8393506.1 hypothetical protein [Chitinophagales bacterium]
MFRYTPSTLHKLEQLFREMHYEIRYEKGSFRSGYCLIHDKKVIVINRFLETEARINALLEILASVEVNSEGLSETSLSLLRQIRPITATA